MLSCPLRDDLGPFGIDEERKLALLLGAINGGIGGGIYDEIGPEVLEPLR